MSGMTMTMRGIPKTDGRRTDALRRIGGVIRLNAMLQLKDVAGHAVMMVIPLVLIPFLLPAEKAALVAEGYAHATGAEQVVPGVTVLFAFFVGQLVIEMFLDDGRLHVWNRQRGCGVSVGELVAGKTAVAFLICVAQVAVTFLAGSFLFGFRPNGSVGAIVVLCLLFSAFLAAYGAAIASWLHVMDHAMVVSNVLGMLMAGVGGTLSPVSTFPAWARPLARATPVYWMMDSLHRLGLGRAGFSDVAPAMLVVLGFTVLALFIAAVGFRRRPSFEDAR